MATTRNRPGGLGVGVAAALAIATGAAAIAIALPGPAHAQRLGRVSTGEAAPNFTLPGADGQRHSLREHRGKIVVLEWTNPVCPYTEAKYEAGDIPALQAFAEDHEIVWYSINTTGSDDRPGYLSPAQARRQVAQSGAKIDAYLIDNGAAVGRRYGARTTPSFVIIDKDGEVAYQGAIDDDVYANGEVSNRYVQEAMSALLAGRTPTTDRTRPYGCPVEY